MITIFMKRASVVAGVVDFSSRAKPLLTKLLPIRFLRWAKKLFVMSAMAKMESEVNTGQFIRGKHPDGINLIGYIRGETGLGQSCRLVADALQESEIDFSVYNYENVSAMRFNDSSWDHKISDSAQYNINLIHIHPYEMPIAYLRMAKDTWLNRYNIAFWLWELEEFPEEWINALSLVNEVWTPSEFASNSIRKVTSKPVHTIPYALRLPMCDSCARDMFNLPSDVFLFLCMFDCNSNFERKNPMGTIAAYKRAFTVDVKDVGLVIKLNNPQNQEIQAILKELEGYSNIFIIKDVLEKKHVNSLISCVDVYVTLHRSEGFGLVPAEAMYLGTPVIATNWSANTEFMDENVACIVDYKYITIQKDTGPFKAGNRWADPDIDQASVYMKKLYANENFRRRVADNAKSHIRDRLAPERAAALIRDRIAEIYGDADKESIVREEYNSENDYYGRWLGHTPLAAEQDALSQAILKTIRHGQVDFSNDH